MLEPPFPPDEAERVASLHRLAILDTTASSGSTGSPASRPWRFGVPITLVSLVDADRQWFKSRIGMSVTETGRRISFCGHGILSDQVFVVPDATADPRFFDNPLVTNEPAIRFYAGVPLDDGEGHKLGMLCVMDRRPRAFDGTSSACWPSLRGGTEEELRTIGLETALRRHQKTLKRVDTITESLVNGFITAERDGVVLTFNAAAERIFGYQRGEVIGRGVDLLTPKTDWQTHRATVGGTQDVAATESDGLVLARRKDGSFFQRN